MTGDERAAAVAEAVRSGLRAGWRDDYSVDSVVRVVTTAVVAALDAQPGDAEQAGGLSERERRMAAVSDEAVKVAEDVWPEDEPTLAEYELTERILAARAAAAPGADAVRALNEAADALEGRLGTAGTPRDLYAFRVWLRDRARELASE